MKKIAFFVEGQTEQIFIDQLIRNTFSYNKIDIEELQFFGKEDNRRIRTIRSVSSDTSSEYFIRVYDCHGGNENSTVKSDIREQFMKLLGESFTFIIGLRDVYPLSDTDKLKSMMIINLPDDSKLPIKIFFAVREIEAWFIAEEKHYALIDDLLTISYVNQIVGFDITTLSTETIHHPSLTLKTIYQSVGKDYNKKKWEIERTVHCLDYENLYIAVRDRNNSLNELLDCLDGLIP